MGSLFVTSDTHFGHEKCLEFMRPDGELLRPFSSVEEMNEVLIERWNEKVMPGDTIYHLGDVAMKRKSLECLARCNGRKILIRGNHDIFRLKDYTEHFEDVRGCFYRDGFVFSHIPIHRESFYGRYQGNVHGHLHCHLVVYENHIDPYYFNACVERHDFFPVAWEDIQAYFA